MSLSSSSIFGSSAIFDSFAMLCRSPGWGLGCTCLARGVLRTVARKPRARQGPLPAGPRPRAALRLPRQAPLQRSELVLERGQRRVTAGLGVDDRPSHLAHPKFTMADMVPPLQLCPVTMCIAPLALLDEEGRQQTTLPVAGHLRHEGLGGAAGGSPQ